MQHSLLPVKKLRLPFEIRTYRTASTFNLKAVILKLMIFSYTFLNSAETAMRSEVNSHTNSGLLRWWKNADQNWDGDNHWAQSLNHDSSKIVTILIVCSCVSTGLFFQAWFLWLLLPESCQKHAKSRKNRVRSRWNRWFFCFFKLVHDLTYSWRGTFFSWLSNKQASKQETGLKTWRIKLVVTLLTRGWGTEIEKRGSSHTDCEIGVATSDCSGRTGCSRTHTLMMRLSSQIRLNWKRRTNPGKPHVNDVMHGTRIWRKTKRNN